jgi:hypothetical protein
MVYMYNAHRPLAAHCVTQASYNNGRMGIMRLASTILVYRYRLEVMCVIQVCWYNVEE